MLHHGLEVVLGQVMSQQLELIIENLQQKKLCGIIIKIKNTTNLIYHKMDSTTQDTLANTATISALFAYIMQFQAEITILVLITSLALNITRLYKVFKAKK